MRVSLVTFGVDDVGRVCAFYEALERSGASPECDVVFFQAGGMVVAVGGGTGSTPRTAWSEDGGGWGGVTLAHIVDSPAAVDAVLADDEPAGATVGRRGAPTFYGGYSGIFVGPDGHPWRSPTTPGSVLEAGGRFACADGRRAGPPPAPDRSCPATPSAGAVGRGPSGRGAS